MDFITVMICLIEVNSIVTLNSTCVISATPGELEHMARTRVTSVSSGKVT